MPLFPNVSLVRHFIDPQNARIFLKQLNLGHQEKSNELINDIEVLSKTLMESLKKNEVSDSTLVLVEKNLLIIEEQLKSTLSGNLDFSAVLSVLASQLEKAASYTH